MAIATDRAPEIIWVEVPPKLSAPDLDRILGELEGYLRRQRPYYLLFDLRESLPDAMQRKKLTDHMRDHQVAIERWVLGLGVVVPSAVARKLMTAIMWFAPPKMPHRICADRGEAEAWVRALKVTTARET